MAKSRAQRKAEKRRRQQQGRQEQRPDSTQAQHDTQVPESADVVEAELAEQGVDLDALRDAPLEGDGAPAQTTPAAPAPSRADVGAPAEQQVSRRERKRAERERRRRAKESEQRRKPKEEPAERRRRSGVLAFFSQVIAELRRVQWPDRAHLIQASAVTLVFIAILAAYLGALDVVFNWFVQQLL
ncbi:MAG TPA: preprotein translocase subunit SecE [Solirubrobacterales bacterium]|nr:preprotein translocase subunit SecE [Solirubrobacterales bacterium]